jgi:translation initiation factor IF-3
LKSGYQGNNSGNKFNREPQRKHRINFEIRVPEVRLIDENNAMLGVVATNEAIRKAELLEMDLVEIAPQAKPPVCKLIDYGKFVYEIAKKEKAAKKNQVQQQMKEIRFKWRTDTHDFNFKTRHAREFLLEGNKVKGTVFFRGREITHKEIGEELLKKFVEELKDVAKVDSPVKFEGKNVNVILAPEKVKAAPKKEKPVRAEKEQKVTESAQIVESNDDSDE